MVSERQRQQIFFEIGDLQGNSGRSLKICLRSAERGLWYDFRRAETAISSLCGELTAGAAVFVRISGLAELFVALCLLLSLLYTQFTVRMFLFYGFSCF